MGPIEQNEGPRKKLHLGLTDIVYENHLRERGSWKEGYEGLWKLALLIIFRASVSFKPRKVVMFTKQFFHLKILNSSKRMKNYIFLNLMPWGLHLIPSLVAKFRHIHEYGGAECSLEKILFRLHSLIWETNMDHDWGGGEDEVYHSLEREPREFSEPQGGSSIFCHYSFCPRNWTTQKCVRKEVHSAKAAAFQTFLTTP